MNKIILTIIVAGFNLFCSNGLAAEFDDNIFLSSIAEVESGNRYWVIGKRNERSAYQISQKVWESYTTIHFKNASRKEFEKVAKNIAKRHLSWIKEQLKINNITPTPQNCAKAWNAGLSAYLQGKISKSTIDYAKRVHNIYISNLNNYVYEQ